MTEWNGGAGPRIVAIGGGTRLSTMLQGGLKAAPAASDGHRHRGR